MPAPRTDMHQECLVARERRNVLSAPVEQQYGSPLLAKEGRKKALTESQSFDKQQKALGQFLGLKARRETQLVAAIAEHDNWNILTQVLKLSVSTRPTAHFFKFCGFYQ